MSSILPASVTPHPPRTSQDGNDRLPASARGNPAPMSEPRDSLER